MRMDELVKWIQEIVGIWKQAVGENLLPVQQQAVSPERKLLWAPTNNTKAKLIVSELSKSGA